MCVCMCHIRWAVSNQRVTNILSVSLSLFYVYFKIILWLFYFDVTQNILFGSIVLLKYVASFISSSSFPSFFHTTHTQYYRLKCTMACSMSRITQPLPFAKNIYPLWGEIAAKANKKCGQYEKKNNNNCDNNKIRPKQLQFIGSIVGSIEFFKSSFWSFSSLLFAVALINTQYTVIAHDPLHTHTTQEMTIQRLHSLYLPFSVTKHNEFFLSIEISLCF